METAMPRRALLAALAFAVLAAAPQAATAHSAEKDRIKVGHAWAPPTEGPNGPIYMPLVNDRDADVTLTGASTPAAARVVLRTGKGEGAEELEALTLQPGQPLSLAAWRVHLWMEGIERPLDTGDSFPLTLQFEPGGALEIEVIVEPTPGH
jgi:hypothetical protein